ncbi:unnamed protein product [Closterium sp. Yama58-4]|nr:unnamed protein product [Closterium sp. Yama58-4]
MCALIHFVSSVYSDMLIAHRHCPFYPFVPFVFSPILLADRHQETPWKLPVWRPSSLPLHAHIPHYPLLSSLHFFYSVLQYLFYVSFHTRFRELFLHPPSHLSVSASTSLHCFVSFCRRLDSNQFTGSIPSALSKLTALTILFLERAFRLFPASCSATHPVHPSPPSPPLVLLPQQPSNRVTYESTQNRPSIPSILPSILPAHPPRTSSPPSSPHILPAFLPLIPSQLRSQQPSYRTTSGLSLHPPPTRFHVTSEATQKSPRSVPLFLLPRSLRSDVRQNKLSGSIPSQYSTLTALEALYLSNNSLSGALPSTLSTLISLRNLLVDNNTISGSIPASFSALVSLVYVRANNNKLSGSLPAGLSILTTLDSLILSRNTIAGSIPSDYSALESLAVL